MPKILNIRESRQAMAEFFCDIEILRNEGAALLNPIVKFEDIL